MTSPKVPWRSELSFPAIIGKVFHHKPYSAVVPERTNNTPRFVFTLEPSQFRSDFICCAIVLHVDSTVVNQAGGRKDANSPPWMTEYITINFTILPTSKAFPSRHEVATYHNQTGYAEEIRVMIWTWAVVEVSITNINCETARFRMTCITGPWGPFSASFPLSWFLTKSPGLIFNAHKPEATKMANIGAARRKSGRFESVQYRNKPQCLYGSTIATRPGGGLTSSGLVRRYRYLAKSFYTKFSYWYLSFHNIRCMQYTVVVENPQQHSNRPGR